MAGPAHAPWGVDLHCVSDVDLHCVNLAGGPMADGARGDSVARPVPHGSSISSDGGRSLSQQWCRHPLLPWRPITTRPSRPLP
ncbi:hypothetical protein BDA96_10G224600 [Sorghum bicolor]|uniref:Uncharacterized protein n=2 Tax=Sorghum bicolor TaxID=4558 RepID=A0A921Q662_SORBI|nr:hypothetical protein SORBI_3010G170700 [Sorghum bicolor]KAG0514800.1 hypothetical protein BDA96_10G224600 [Sorghum bicolor]KAG0514801.1 hypothetical protein BDA96_10G224600 [Sorghum bicolor]